MRLATIFSGLLLLHFEVCIMFAYGGNICLELYNRIRRINIKFDWISRRTIETLILHKWAQSIMQ